MSNLFMVVDAVPRGDFGGLTRHRVPGALPFGAKYRLVDFTLSNCKNSEIRNVAIFPYGNYRSLADHIGSGDRWDLNRRKDGIFLLPPKNLDMTSEQAVSFQRMYEQVEYFLRSTQEYVIVSPCTIVWNLDYNVILHHHLVTKADITEVLTPDGRRLKTFVLSKKRLLEYILEYDTIPFRNLIEVYDNAPDLVKERFVFEPVCFAIDNAADLYRADMALLSEPVRNQIFSPNRPIYSKETMSSPSRYGKEARVRNSLVASGASIEGTVLGSLIGRKAVVKKGAVVVDSVVMNQCTIEEGAKVEAAILDKETRVLAQAAIRGTPSDLFVTEKKQVVANDEKLSVLQIAAECQPFVKTGGLADVVGALALEYARLGVESRVVLPLYPAVREKYRYLMELRSEGIVVMDGKKYRATVYTYHDEGVIYSFIESFDFFDREKIYGYPDDGDRFAFFSKACLVFADLLPTLPDIVQVHDWHGGLIPLLMREDPRFRESKSLFTLHNLEYQGVFDADLLRRAGIPNPFGNTPFVNFMEIGLTTATKIATVSPTYREELKYEYYSKNFVNLIIRRDRDFYGILNGLGEEIDPARDLAIARRYSSADVASGKAANKADLQKRMGLLPGNDRFVLGMVTRIVEQKGFDILFYALDQILQDERVEFVLLGTGEERYVLGLRQMEARFPGRVKMNIGYDATLPNYIYAGADAFLMPSRYEPCGTGQMIALRYGTIPIVRQTGGLNDTVEPFNSAAGTGNGFKFYHFDSRDLIQQIENAHRIFREDPPAWTRLVQNAMASRFSFEATAKAYIALFRSMR